MKMKKLTSCYLHCKHTSKLSENIIIVVSDHRFVVNRTIPVIWSKMAPQLFSKCDNFFQTSLEESLSEFY